MQMPEPNPDILARKAELVARLRKVLPRDAVIEDPVETRAYECDALTAYRCAPMAVVLPGSTAEVAAVLKVCHEDGVKVVPRGSGTSVASSTTITSTPIALTSAEKWASAVVVIPTTAAFRSTCSCAA